jgi:hypothetical protein
VVCSITLEVVVLLHCATKFTFHLCPLKKRKKKKRYTPMFDQYHLPFLFDVDACSEGFIVLYFGYQ